MSHLLLARTDPFPKTVAILCSGTYRTLLAPKAQVSAAWVFSAVPAATVGLGRSIKGSRCSLDAVTKPEPVGDSAGSAVTQGLAAGGGRPLARGRKASRCQPVGKGLDLRALGRSPRLRQGDHSLLFASYHPRKLSGRGKLFLRASSCTGNSQQQGSESIRLLPVLCFLLICLPPHAEPPCRCCAQSLPRAALTWFLCSGAFLCSLSLLSGLWGSGGAVWPHCHAVPCPHLFPRGKLELSPRVALLLLWPTWNLWCRGAE